jgi:HAD superfamily hydrolase (TIGR01484 family)
MPPSPRNISNYDLIIFDLDGTLAPSKSPLEPDIAELIIKLIAKIKVAVISGGGYPQFGTQFLNGLPASSSSENFSNLFLLPASGTCLYAWKGMWCEQYCEKLSPQEKADIMQTFHDALRAAGYVRPEKTYGEILEDRGSQITFSALGQSAPLMLKSAWDPGRTKRMKIAEILKLKLPRYDVRIGGTTSIDVTPRGVNKAYGIRKLEEYLKIESERIVFVGDALYQGGNDYPAKATGVDCIQVKGPEETKQLIQAWLR